MKEKTLKNNSTSRNYQFLLKYKSAVLLDITNLLFNQVYCTEP